MTKKEFIGKWENQLLAPYPGPPIYKVRDQFRKDVDALLSEPAKKKSDWVQIQFAEVECPNCKEWKFIEKKAKMAGGTDYLCRTCDARWSEPCL